MATDQPDMGSRLEALLAQLAQLDFATAGAVDPAAAVHLAHGAQALVTDVQELADGPEFEAIAGSLSSVVPGVLTQLKPLLSALATRVSCQRPSTEADLSLLLAASELLRACFDAATLDDASKLSHAQTACSCFVTFSRAAAAAAMAAAASGSGLAPLGYLVILNCSLLDLAVSGMCAAHDLGADAAELAPPGELAACLADVVELTQQLEHTAGAGWAHKLALQVVVQSLLSLAHGTLCEQHVEALASHARLSSGALQLALSRVRTLAVGMQLPEDRRPPDCTHEAAAHTAGLLASGMLADALVRWAQAADGASAAAAIAAAAQLAQQMPLDEQQAGPLQAVPAIAVATLLGLLCLPLWQDTGLLARQNLVQRRRVAAQLLPVLGRFPQLLQLVAGAGPPQSLSEQHLQVIADLCSLARFQAAILCHYRQDDLHASAQGLISSPDDAAAWAQAARAAMRCFPLLCELHVAERQAGQTAAPVGANLVHDLDELAVQAAGALLQQKKPGQGLPTAAPSEIMHVARALHTALCRRVHFAAGSSSAPFQLSQPSEARRAVGALSLCMCASAAMHYETFRAADRRSPSPSDGLLQADRQLQAMGVAHWHALAACGSHQSLAQMGSSTAGPHVAVLLPGLAAMLYNAPLSLVLEPGLQELFRRCWHQTMQDATARGDHLRMMLHCATASPRLAAFLATGGYLEPIVQEARRHQVEGLHKAVAGVMLTLQAAAGELAASSHGASSSSAPAPDAASSADVELAQQLCRHVAAFVLPKQPWTVAGVRAALPATHRLAFSLLDWWRRPGAQPEQQLEAAQAAAARSCAYLRCANLGGGGGPAAGQGEGSQRCSGCRAVWYCGTACSHADWRAGHKRVCQALGAARAAARRQAAGEEQAM